MNELMFALVVMLFGRDGAVVPIRPAPIVVQPGELVDLSDPEVMYGND